MQQNPKGISFTTAAGNSYFYNDSDGTVIPESYLNHHKQSTCQIDRFNRDPLINEESDDKTKLRQAVFETGYTQLILINTEQCNLRCKYCAYSGEYTNSRVHSNARMEWGVAEKAINTFMKGYSSAKMRRPGLSLRVSFYGGEPLLNFNLIRHTVAFMKKWYPGNTIYNLTTNGTLLTSEMLKLFRDNDFHLMFSLNGNQAEHDRLRVFPDGHGSFDLTWHNLQTIRRTDLGYFEHNCSFNVVYDVGTDLKKLYSFLENRRELLPTNYETGIVNSEFTQYYTRYSTKDYERFREDKDHFQKMYVDTLLAGENPSFFLNKLIGKKFLQLARRMQNIPVESRLIPFTGTCIPGMKMAVRPDGSVHCCERVSHHFPIGDVDSGFDYDLILSLINKYNSQIVSQCSDCPISRLCKFCFAGFGGDGIFQKDPPDCCQVTIESTRNDLSLLYTLLEKGVPESAFIPSYMYL